MRPGRRGVYPQGKTQRRVADPQRTPGRSGATPCRRSAGTSGAPSATSRSNIPPVALCAGLHRRICVYHCQQLRLGSGRQQNDYAWPAGIIGAARKVSDTGAIRITNITVITGTELTAVSAPFKIRPSLTAFPRLCRRKVVCRWGEPGRHLGLQQRDQGVRPCRRVVLEYNVDAGNSGRGAGSLDSARTNNYTWPAIPDDAATTPSSGFRSRTIRPESFLAVFQRFIRRSRSPILF